MPDSRNTYGQWPVDWMLRSMKEVSLAAQSKSNVLWFAICAEYTEYTEYAKVAYPRSRKQSKSRAAPASILSASAANADKHFG